MKRTMLAAMLVALALTSMIGTLIPQNESPATYIQAYGEFAYRLLSVLNVFDMYHSWWFRVLLLMLAANVVVCSIDRLSATWRIIFPKSVKFSAGRFRKLAGAVSFSDRRSPEKLAASYQPLVAKHFRTTRVAASGSGTCVFGEKWRWARIGVYVVHLSVILLLAGGLIGSFFGFEGFVNIAEGEAKNKIFLRNSHQSMTLDFAIRCDDFDVSFYKSGAP